MRKTQNEFIAELLGLYGDALEYDKVVYVNAHTPVTLRCKEHGEFSLTPNTILSKHVGNSPCPSCGFNRKSKVLRGTIEHKRRSLLDKLGDKVIHTGEEGSLSNDCETTFKCSAHGDFISTFRKVLSSQNGCPKCGGRFIINDKELIHNFIIEHPESSFVFDKTSFKFLTDKIIVTCNIHGDFETTWRDFCRNSKCPDCIKDYWVKSDGREALCQLDEATIRKFVVNALPEYPLISAEKEDGNWYVKLSCTKHGDFRKYFTKKNFSSTRCPRCAQPLKTAAGFMEASREKFGDKFEYDLKDYCGPFTYVRIECPTHGKFTQLARSHIGSSTGCPSCAVGGYKRAQPGILYVLASASYVKVGIVNKDLRRRLREINGTSVEKFSVVTTYKSENGKVVYSAEQEVLKRLSSTLKKATNKALDGGTEIFVSTDLAYVINTVEEVFRAKEREMFEEGCVK